MDFMDISKMRVTVHKFSQNPVVDLSKERDDKEHGKVFGQQGNPAFFQS